MCKGVVAGYTFITVTSFIYVPSAASISIPGVGSWITRPIVIFISKLGISTKMEHLGSVRSLCEIEYCPGGT